VGRPPETLANLSLAGAALDRAAHRRRAAGLLEALLGDPATRVLQLEAGSAEVLDGAGHGDGRGGRGGPGDDGLRLALRRPLPADREALGLFLGEDGDGTAYVAVVGDAVDSEGARDLRTLRQVGADLGHVDADLFTTALGLANWHATHTHCPRCGAPTRPEQAGWLRVCTEDGTEHYPRTDPAVIMSVVDDDDRLLMARGAGWGEGRFSVLAGFVEPGESLEAAVAREVREEVGVEVADVRFLGDQPWPFPTSIMLGFTARAVTTELTLQRSEIAEARWFTRAELLGGIARRELGISPRLSISRGLVERWVGHPVDGPP